jgi:solute carrier family 25 (mitochondrial aspartate/glutamate transporter), member 12/13
LCIALRTHMKIKNMKGDDQESHLIRTLTKSHPDTISRSKSKEDEELIRLALHQSPFFTCLDEEQVVRFVKAAQLKTYPPGEVVILEGYIDDDTKLGDIEPLDTKGLLKRLLMMETNDSDDSQTDKHDNQTLTQNEVNGDQLHDIANNDNYENENSEGDEDFFQDEVDETYVSLDYLSSMESIQNGPHEKEHIREDDRNLDPTADENFGGGMVDEMDYEFDEETLHDSSNKPTETDIRNSGITSYVYTVRSGSAHVWHGDVHISSLGKGTIFGEGGFLFHRQHSASVVATESEEGLECWVVPAKLFREYVLPSENMIRMFAKYATHKDENGNPYMTMDDFVNSCLDREGDGNKDPFAHLRMANTYKLLRRPDGIQRISLANFCLFHLIMSRPDPEVDIAFLLLDKDRTGTITLDNLATFLDTQDRRFFNMDCDFVKRHFGQDGSRSIRPNNVSQFLADFQQEMGRQAFLYEVEIHGTPEGYLNPSDFVQVLKTACGWRLPIGVIDRLENLYCKDPMEAAEAAAIMSIKAENLKGSTSVEVTRSTTASILANLERRSKLLGDRFYSYGDFLAFQEVLLQLPGICNLLHRACEIKKGPVSPDDFKVANLVIGLGGKLTRRQVDIIFQLFDLDHDGFVSGEDASTVMGVDFVYRLEATTGREGKLTFAPPPDYRLDMLPIESSRSDEEVKFSQYIKNYMYRLAHGALAGALGGIAGVILAPLDLLKTRMQLHRFTSEVPRLYTSTFDCIRQTYKGEGILGFFRGSLPYMIGIVPQRAFQLTVYSQICRVWEYKHNEEKYPTVDLEIQVLGGGVAGACKVLFGNLFEITKIDFQIEGETNRLLQKRGEKIPPRLSLNVIRQNVGVGYHRGVVSSLWRDVPYSAMFFPMYTIFKSTLPEHTSHSILDPFVAGCSSGVAASILTTPFDVIKTRLQASPRDITYGSFFECATKMFRDEGWVSFFKGTSLRAMRSGPHMGLTMAAYENLSVLFEENEKKRECANDSADYRRAYPTRGYGIKIEEIDGLLNYFGLSKHQEKERKGNP